MSPIEDIKQHVNRLINDTMAGISAISNIQNNLNAEISIINTKFDLLLKKQEPVKLYIPLFIYPDVSGLASWKQVADLRIRYPQVDFIVCLNPNNGQFVNRNSDYDKSITILNNAGIKMIGYIQTDYGDRPFDDVKTNIDNYKTFYPEVNYGVFLDEMQDKPGKEQHYRDITDYAKSKGFQFIIGNPGTSTIQAYINSVDCVLVYESAGLPTLETVKTRTLDGISKERFGIIPYGVTTLDSNYIQDIKQYIGLIYVTNGKGASPWDSLPPYLEQLVKALSSD